jgi:hypothetical protein
VLGPVSERDCREIFVLETLVGPALDLTEVLKPDSAGKLPGRANLDVPVPDNVDVRNLSQIPTCERAKFLRPDVIAFVAELELKLTVSESHKLFLSFVMPIL